MSIDQEVSKEESYLSVEEDSDIGEMDVIMEEPLLEVSTF